VVELQNATVRQHGNTDAHRAQRPHGKSSALARLRRDIDRAGVCDRERVAR
jgi:hypothetical protein